MKPAAIFFLLLMLGTACTNEPPMPSASGSSPEIQTPAVQPTPRVYIARRGDYLAKIADEFGVPLARLLELNEIPNPERILVGQAIVIDDAPAREPPTGSASAADARTEGDPVPSSGSDRSLDQLPGFGLTQDQLTLAGAAVAALFAATLLLLGLRAGAVIAVRSGVPIVRRAVQIGRPGVTEGEGAADGPDALHRGSSERTRLLRVRRPTIRARPFIRATSRTLRATYSRLGRQLRRGLRGLRRIALATLRELKWLAGRGARASRELAAHATDRVRSSVGESPEIRQRREFRATLEEWAGRPINDGEPTDLAERNILQALDECREQGWDLERGICMVALAKIELSRGDTRWVADRLDEADAAFRSAGDQSRVVQVLALRSAHRSVTPEAAPVGSARRTRPDDLLASGQNSYRSPLARRLDGEWPPEPPRNGQS